MALVPLPVDELERYLVTGTPSGDQYGAYWGISKQDRFEQLLESASISFLGVIFCYFLSFVLGSFVATLMGGLFAFYGILSPELKARQRNWQLLAGRELVDPWVSDGSDPSDDAYYDGFNDFSYDDGTARRTSPGLYGSLYVGRVNNVCIVEEETSRVQYDLDEFADYDVNADEYKRWAGTPYLLRLNLIDTQGRELQVHTRMMEQYLEIFPGMPVLCILLSPFTSFSNLAGLTDVMIPDAGCWVGDYPYLNRPEMEALLAEDDEIFDIFESESGLEEDNLYASPRSAGRNSRPQYYLEGED